MNDFKTFEAAAKAFERLFNCRLCLHDYVGRFVGVPLPRFHLNPFCTELKKRHPKAERVCVAFDHYSIQKEAGNSPEPFYKYCPYGYLEAIFPVMPDGRLGGILFAGPFKCEGSSMPKAFHANIQDDNPVLKLPPVLLPERQGDLTALGVLLAEQLAACVSHPREGGGTRRELIEQFIDRHYGNRQSGLPELAEFIGLTPARTSELVKRTFGESFVTLLNRKRISAAQQMLQYSAFNLEMIASRCGFNDSAYFHRVFRRCCGETPAQYRERTARPTA